MKISITKRLLVVFLLLTIISCSSASEQYSNLASEVSKAVKTNDYESLLLISKRITNAYFLKEDGVRFLKLKITILTFSGKYKNAFTIISDNIQKFPEDYELLVGQGIIANRLRKDGSVYFLKAYNMLKDKPIKTETELVLEFYLAKILDIEESAYLQRQILPNLSDQGIAAVKYYESLSKKDLLLTAPMGFVANKPILNSKGKENEEWWN